MSSVRFDGREFQGTYDDSTATGIVIDDSESGHNGILVVNAEYTIKDAEISLLTDADGSDTCDFSGKGTAMVNHMYFSQFPFQDRPVSLKDETVALYAVYALLRFLTIGAGDGTHERMTDIAAALFRLVDHTAFDRYAIPILKRICGDGSVIKLLML